MCSCLCKKHSNYTLFKHLLFAGVVLKANMSYSTTSGLKLKDTAASAVIVLSPDKGVSTGRNDYIEWAATTHQ
jgi:hypothetical protein